MLILLLALASPTFSFFTRARSGDASQGVAYYLGGEDVLSVADAKVSQGVAVAVQLGWDCDATVCTLTNNAEYVGPTGSGHGSGSVKLFFNNSTFVGAGEMPMTGRFMLHNDDKLVLTGQATDAAGRAVIVTAEVTRDKISEVTLLFMCF